MKRGFTLLELIVVMAIATVIGGLILYGLFAFRQTSILKQASREFFTALESTKNKARNSTLSSVKQGTSTEPLDGRVDAYAIVLGANNQYSLYYCNEVVGSALRDYDCFVEIQNMKLEVYKDIRFTNVGSIQCAGFLFENATGKIKLFTDISNVKTRQGKCNLEISYGTTAIKEKLEIDADQQRIYYIQ